MNFISNLLSLNLQSSIKQALTGAIVSNYQQVDEIEKTIEDCSNNYATLDILNDTLNIVNVTVRDTNILQLPSKDLVTNFVYDESESSIMNNNQQRRRKQMLTTCRKCGHYRFAKRDGKDIVNENYPYEDSSKGGCPVPLLLHIRPGEKFRKLCSCNYCTVNTTAINKRNKYNYDITIIP